MSEQNNQGSGQETAAYCKVCGGGGTVSTGIAEASSTQCRFCDGTGYAAPAPVYDKSVVKRLATQMGWTPPSASPAALTGGALDHVQGCDCAFPEVAGCAKRPLAAQPAEPAAPAEGICSKCGYSNDELCFECDPPAEPAPKLAVWYGSMPESNGKSNWTAILHAGDIAHGITLDRSEYPDRVRYEADRARFLIGELKGEPFILDYDADKHSGYAEPASADRQAAKCSCGYDRETSCNVFDPKCKQREDRQGVALSDEPKLVAGVLYDLKQKGFSAAAPTWNRPEWNAAFEEWAAKQKAFTEYGVGRQVWLMACDWLSRASSSRAEVERDAAQLSQWLLTDPETGERLRFAGPLERDFLGLSRVRMESASGAVWTLIAGIKEGYLTASERMENIRLAAAEVPNGEPISLTACKGMNCGCTDGASHSLECQAEASRTTVSTRQPPGRIERTIAAPRRWDSPAPCSKQTVLPAWRSPHDHPRHYPSRFY